MKRGILFLLILIPLVSTAPSINFQNEEIQPGETILGTISTLGEFTSSITTQDISFFEGRRPTSFEYEIFQYNGTYYFYIYANREGNYSIKIENVLYKEEDLLASIDLEKTFTIKENPEIIQEEINESGNITFQNKSITKIIQIKPGVLFTSQTPKVKLINKGSSEIELEYGDEKIILEPSETKEINPPITGSFQFFNFSTYKNFAVPIIYLSGINQSFEKETSIKTDKTLIHINLITNREQIENLTLFNFADENITSIEISEDLEILKIEGLSEINAKTDEIINLTFNSIKAGYEEGTILIEWEEAEETKNITIQVIAYILSNVTNESEFEISGETCAEKSGRFCSSKEYCEGNSTFTSDNPHYCCLGNCKVPEVPKKQKNYGWVIGIIIFVGLGIGGYFIYKKYKKTKPQKPEEKLKETEKSYEKRIKGRLTRT